MAKTMHVHLSVRGALRDFSRRELANLFTDSATGRDLTADHAKDRLMDHLTAGRMSATALDDAAEAANGDGSLLLNCFFPQTSQEGPSSIYLRRRPTSRIDRPLRHAEKLIHRPSGVNYPRLSGSPRQDQIGVIGFDGNSPYLLGDHPRSRNNVDYFQGLFFVQFPNRIFCHEKLCIHAIHMSKQNLLCIRIGETTDKCIGYAPHIRLCSMQDRPKADKCNMGNSGLFASTFVVGSGGYMESHPSRQKGCNRAQESANSSDGTPVEATIGSANAWNKYLGREHGLSPLWIGLDFATENAHG